MSRTIDHIVRTHKLAQECRLAGKPIWNLRVPVRAIIKRDQSNASNEHAATVANEIAALLRARLPNGLIENDSDLADIIEQLEELRATSYADDPSFSPLEDLNARLEELYDWADINRVWLG